MIFCRIAISVCLCTHGKITMCVYFLVALINPGDILYITFFYTVTVSLIHILFI